MTVSSYTDMSGTPDRCKVLARPAYHHQAPLVQRIMDWLQEQWHRLLEQSQVAAGKMRVLAVTSPKRSPILPNVPTVGESYKGFNATTWFGLLAPAGTPRAIVMKLTAEANRVLKDPNVRKSIETEGGEVLGGTPEEFGAYMKSEIANWATLVRDSGAKVD